MKTTINKIAGILFFMSFGLFGFSQNSNGQIKGVVLDDEHNPVMGAIVKVLQGGMIMKQEATDMDGKYSLKQLQAGNYEVLVTYTGYKTSRFPNVEVGQEETAYVDVDLEMNTLTGVEVVSTKEWEKPIVDVNYITMHKLNHEQLSQMAVTKGDVKGMIANISSDIFVTDDGLLYSRGARPGASKYFVDGDLMPFPDTDVSGMAIQNLSVITGGIPAQYGDVTGAVIVITTRDYFSGIAEQNIRNRKYQEKVKKQKEDAAYEVAKKKREEEIEKEKQAEKEKQQQVHPQD
jgi:hypothetical protein